MSIEADFLDTLLGCNVFDPVWYSKHHPDLGILGMQPAYHYRKYGYELGRAPNARFAGIPNWKTLLNKPRPKDGHELLEAYEISLSGDYDLALTYAQMYLTPERLHSIDVLHANAALAEGDDSKWLYYLNRYLDHHGVAPIRLENGHMLIDRISCRPLPPQENGPKISVLMPAWNAEDTVRAAARSILNQTWRNLELIIVDDASTDKTWSILQEVSFFDDRVRILRNPVNVGPYASKNIALLGARGEFVTGQDADDWAHPERLAQQAEHLLQTDGVSCLSGMVRMELNGTLNRISPVGKNTRDGATRSAFISLMIRRRFLRDRLGGWDDVRFGADSELIRRQERAIGHKTARLFTPTMICFDNPKGLTNHPEHGHNSATGVSKIRQEYAESFMEWHRRIPRNNVFLPFPHQERQFYAPAQALNDPKELEKISLYYKDNGWSEGDDIEADIAIITNFRFPGGNASSTLEEIKYFLSQGLSVKCIHCPTDKTLGRNISSRYDGYLHLIHDYKDVKSLKSKALILRSPSTIISNSFSIVAPKINTDYLFFVKNNSAWRITGERVYDPLQVVDAILSVRANERTIVPISPIMRSEAKKLRFDCLPDINLSDIDWNPTFDLYLYNQEPKLRLQAPFRIGRHGRDGPEKWLLDQNSMLKVYPRSPDYIVRILGGADKAKEILGAIPDNWEVLPFGTMSPLEYLRDLDIFVYYPNENLSEAFGRTVVEAMIAGVPCILPKRFYEVFGNLAFYARPERVQTIVKMLSDRDECRVAFLKEVQDIAANRYSTITIADRFSHVFEQLPSLSKGLRYDLSEDAVRYARSIQEKDDVENSSILQFPK